MNQTRPPAVHGLFYPATPQELSATIRSLIKPEPDEQCEAAPPTAPAALIVPHAGYIYSAPIAASAFRLLLPWQQHYRRAIVIGPAHRVAFNGIALPGCSTFTTPLGNLAIDQIAIRKLEPLPFISHHAQAHQLEHSLEVQLPFLQQILTDFTIIPLLVGHATAEMVATAIENVIDEHTLIVVSSDLSHYHPYEVAQSMDKASCDQILTNSAPLNHHQACGATAINGLMQFATSRQWRPRLLDLRNSGDTAGDHQRVVGYAAVAYDHD